MAYCNDFVLQTMAAFVQRDSKAFIVMKMLTNACLETRVKMVASA